jgi:hypothetical protein
MRILKDIQEPSKRPSADGSQHLCQYALHGRLLHARATRYPTWESDELSRWWHLALRGWSLPSGPQRYLPEEPRTGLTICDHQSFLILPEALTEEACCSQNLVLLSLWVTHEYVHSFPKTSRNVCGFLPQRPPCSQSLNRAAEWLSPCIFTDCVKPTVHDQEHYGPFRLTCYLVQGRSIYWNPLAIVSPWENSCPNS